MSGLTIIPPATTVTKEIRALKRRGLLIDRELGRENITITGVNLVVTGIDPDGAPRVLMLNHITDMTSLYAHLTDAARAVGEVIDQEDNE